MPSKRYSNLIFIRHVKGLIAREAKFQTRYDLVGFAVNGTPQYTCNYIYRDENGLLLDEPLGSERQSRRGQERRRLGLWPGLLKHHFEWGDGSAITIDSNFIITCGEQRGRDDVSDKREGSD